jgi:hypothetical protein
MAHLRAGVRVPGIRAPAARALAGPWAREPWRLGVPLSNSARGCGASDRLATARALELSPPQHDVLPRVPSEVTWAAALVQPVQVVHEVQDGRAPSGGTSSLDRFDPTRCGGERPI